ncbi:MAG: hypothetical protein Kow0027_31750 [Saprospiraceae bacterium]
MKFLYTILAILSFGLSANAQFTKDRAVPIYITVNPDTPSVHLDWLTPTAIHDATVFRREKGESAWYIIEQTQQSIIHEYTDTDVEVGKTYEYGIERLANGIYAYGYATVPVMAPVLHDRGYIAVFCEAMLEDSLAAELELLRSNLTGDGWQVLWHSVGQQDSTGSIKSSITGDYSSTNGELKAVLLFGEIPVPYSGNSAWDGHGNHQGAWPADVWYGELDGNWTDVSVNNTTPSRPQNDNVPGDGKFDQSFLPSAVEVAVGRVDFSNLSEADFGTTRIELYRRYLDKNHRWRNKLFTVDNKVLIDDNFGYFGGEAFAANGWRNGYPLVGVDNVMDGDFFADTDSNSYLMIYGCGGGSYTSANGVGNSLQFTTDTINAVFSMLFGSYHGDWDYSPNPFMMSALASRGGILSCSWAGRPHWFYHPLAAGATLADCTLASQNACYDQGYFNSLGACGAHVALLGDPSLRAQIVEPVSGLMVADDCGTVSLQWEAATAANATGYFVYRSENKEGPYELLTQEAIAENEFSDNPPLANEYWYMVKTVALESTPSGLFYNTSTGRFINATARPVPEAEPTATALTCVTNYSVLQANPAQEDYLLQWTGPGGFMATGDSVTASNFSEPYLLTVTDTASGCSSEYSIEIPTDYTSPNVNIGQFFMLTCDVTAIDLDCPSDDLECYIINPAGDTLGTPASLTEPGEYIYLAVFPGNGCYDADNFEVVVDTTPPMLEVDGNPEIICESTVLEALPGNMQDAVVWDGPGISSPFLLEQTIEVPGTYTVTSTNPLGCQTVLTIEVTKPFPSLVIGTTSESVDCFGNITGIDVVASGGLPPYSWQVTPALPIVPGQTYTIVLTDSNGCTAQISQENSNQPSVPGLALSSTSETSAGSMDGTATAQATGANPPFTYLWSNGQTEATATGLSAGTYTVTVTDANGCQAVGSVEVDLLNSTSTLPGLLSFGLRPNPSSGTFTASLSLNEPLSVKLDILDNDGKVVHRAGTKTGLELSWKVELPPLANGTYWCRWSSNGKVLTRKILIVRN